MSVHIISLCGTADRISADVVVSLAEEPKHFLYRSFNVQDLDSVLRRRRTHLLDEVSDCSDTAREGDDGDEKDLGFEEGIQAL